MTTLELAVEVWDCLPPHVKKRVTARDVHLVVKLSFETIGEHLLVGDEIKIRNFGKITATLIKGGTKFWCEPMKRMVVRKPNIRIKFMPSSRLRNAVGSVRKELRARAKKGIEAMEKYGYEAEKKDEEVKEASEKNKCPKCGSTLKGNPPV